MPAKTGSIGNSFLALLIAWILPGGGHLYLGRPARGALIFISVCGMYLFGIMMQGALFSPQGGDLLTTLIYYGGFIGNLLSGLPFFFSKWFGYAQVDIAGHVHDYGTKFLVGAGLLNVLGMVDAVEIAAGIKD